MGGRKRHLRPPVPRARGEGASGTARRRAGEGGQETAPGGPLRNRRLYGILLALAAMTAMTYQRTVSNSFVPSIDDDLYITANPVVQQGLTLPGAAWAFTTGHAANWHPLTWLSHMLDVSLFGADPGMHHLVSLLFHIGNALLLFLVLFRMTGGIWPSAFAAAYHYGESLRYRPGDPVVASLLRSVLSQGKR